MREEKNIIFPLSAFTDNYIWLFIDPQLKQVCCVDPGDANPVIKYLKQQDLILKAVLLTHHHFDHIGGVPQLLANYPNIDIYGPQDNRIPYNTRLLTAKEYIKPLPFYTLQVINTPGHTSTHISLYEPNQQWLFCGDTLFSAGCGRVFDGTIEALFNSLQIINALPNETKIFCAHEYTRQNLRFAQQVEPNNKEIEQYALKLSNHDQCTLPSTLNLEKKINPFLRTKENTVVNYALSHANKISDELSVFKQLRADKDHFC